MKSSSGSSTSDTSPNFPSAGDASRVGGRCKGRWVDNVFVERLWRSVKYEEVYLHAYESVATARVGIANYLAFFKDRKSVV